MEELAQTRIAAMEFPEPQRSYELNVLAEEGRKLVRKRGAKRARQFLLQAEEQKTKLKEEGVDLKTLVGNSLDTVLDRITLEPVNPVSQGDAEAQAQEPQQSSEAHRSEPQMSTEGDPAIQTETVGSQQEEDSQPIHNPLSTLNGHHFHLWEVHRVYDTSSIPQETLDQWKREREEREERSQEENRKMFGEIQERKGGRKGRTRGTGSCRGKRRLKKGEAKKAKEKTKGETQK